MLCKNGASAAFLGGTGGLCGVLFIDVSRWKKKYYLDIKGSFHKSFLLLEELFLFLLVLIV